MNISLSILNFILKLYSLSIWKHKDMNCYEIFVVCIQLKDNKNMNEEFHFTLCYHALIQVVQCY
jgi:hypothetical protein